MTKPKKLFPEHAVIDFNNRIQSQAKAPKQIEEKYETEINGRLVTVTRYRPVKSGSWGTPTPTVKSRGIDA